MSEFRDRPAGTIRITAAKHAASSVLWPTLAKFLPKYPDIKVEVAVDNAMTDIAAERFDAGVRLGEQVAKDMIAVPIGPEQRMAVVASPAYLAERTLPKTPQQLVQHTCINLRPPTHGGLYAWEFEKDGKELIVRVEGQLVFNRTPLILDAAVKGFGIAMTPEDVAQPLIASGQLKRVLKDWCDPFPGYHLYYPSRRHASPAFALMVEALRHR